MGKYKYSLDVIKLKSVLKYTLCLVYMRTFATLMPSEVNFGAMISFAELAVANMMNFDEGVQEFVLHVYVKFLMVLL